jgi:hypothetical protein
MVRALLAVLALGAPVAATAADDLKVIRLEQDVRDLQRQVGTLTQQLAQLRSQLARPAGLPAPAPAPGAAVASGAAPARDQWVDAAKWDRVKPGISELEVVGLLGPPTSMRAQGNERVLLYAMEIGSSGFLGGSVTLRDRAVVDVSRPELR